MTKKICSKCKIEKDVCEFNKRKDSKDGLRGYCKKCHVGYTNGYVQNNLKKYNEYQEKYHRENTQRHREKSNEYYKNNREKVFDYYKKKYKEDFLYRLKHNLRCRINLFLKKKNITKRNNTYDIIGCSPTFLKEYIQNKFTEGMTWDLIGNAIHIDHIIPLSSAKTEDEIYKLCHYTNLPPLWAKENLQKNNKLIY